MGRFTGLLLCSDFDGTLLASSAGISRANLDAVRYFQENGGLFTLATGRYPTILDDPKAKGISCNAPLVSINGTLIYDTAKKKILLETPLDAGYIDALLEICRTCEGIDHVRLCCRDGWNTVIAEPADEEIIRRTLADSPYKVVVCVEKDRALDIKARMRALSDEKYDVARSWQTGIEVNLKSANKGAAARRLANMVGADTLICVGDYENDISMVKEADIGVAMGNAVDELKAVADRITASASEDGVAKLIYEL